MSFDSFIQHISAGKIRLKYRIVENKFTKGQVLLFDLLMLVCYFITIAWAVYALSEKMGLFACIIPFIFLAGSNYFINKWISKFISKGTVFFDSENLTITTNTDITIPYAKIKALNFKIQLRGITTSGKYKTKPHSYMLQILTDQDVYVMTVERKLFLTEEDNQQFNRGYPDIIWTLTELQKVYRFPAVEKERKVKFEGIICST